MSDTSAAPAPAAVLDHSTLERVGAMQKAQQRALDYRALAEAAFQAANASPLERTKTQHQISAGKWIELAEREERRAEASRQLLEPR